MTMEAPKQNTRKMLLEEEEALLQQIIDETKAKEAAGQKDKKRISIVC